MFQMASAVLSARAGIDPKTLYALFLEREKLGSTAIAPGLAIPHVMTRGIREFDILLVRCKDGVIFPEVSLPVYTNFVLIGPEDERNFYLRALAAIAQIAQDKNFARNWLEAGTVEDLREIILSAERKRVAAV
jgi:mannitol/fructose-specific phosphotransferase system IIA component (Ntr-type)